MKKTYSLEEARDIAHSLDIHFEASGFDLEQFRAGLDVEAEHGQAVTSTNVTNDDPLITGKIALAHLNELPDYYTRLYRMETEAEAVAPDASGAHAMPPAGMTKVALPRAVIFGVVAAIIGSLLARALVRLKRRRNDPPESHASGV